MNARKQLAAHLAAALPRKQYNVIAAPREIDVPEKGRPVVMVIRTELAPAANSAGSYLTTFALWVIEPKQIDPEDDLDDVLDDVIVALDGFPFVSWSKAERSTYKEQPAYRLDLTTLTEKE